MDLPIFIGNTYCLFVAKVLDLNGIFDFLKHICYKYRVFAPYEERRIEVEPHWQPVGLNLEGRSLY